jgi:hypothetical protein
MEMITVNIQLEPLQYQTFSTEAEKRNVSIEQFLTDLVKEQLYLLFLSPQPHPVDFMSFVGLGDSGASDISVNHDKYLGEIIANEHLR